MRPSCHEPLVKRGGKEQKIQTVSLDGNKRYSIRGLLKTANLNSIAVRCVAQGKLIVDCESG